MIWTSMLDGRQSMASLADQLESMFKLSELKDLCSLFGTSKSSTTKPVYVKRLITFLSSDIYPRLEQIRMNMTQESYNEMINRIGEYIYTRIKTPSQVVEEPIEWKQMMSKEPISINTTSPRSNEIGEADQLIRGLISVEEGPNISESVTREANMYTQFAVLYFLSRLKTNTLPSLKDYKSYIVEQGVIRPVKEELQQSYTSMYKEIKKISNDPQEQMQYLYGKLSISPSVSRSPSPERKEKEEVVEIIHPIEQIEEDMKSPVEFQDVHPLREAVVHYLLESYDSKKTVSFIQFKNYLSDHGIIGPNAKDVYESIMEEIKPYKYKAEEKKNYLKGLLSTLNNPSGESLSETIPLEEVGVETIQEEPLVSLADRELVLSPVEQCNVEETHSSLESLAEDLSCSIGNACDLEKQQCVPISDAPSLTTLQIGNKTVSVVGKSEQDIVREVKKEILRLSLPIPGTIVEPINPPINILKKYNTQPIDLDKLYKSLRSSQSSLSLYSQHKVEVLHQKLQEKIKKCFI